MKNLAVEYAKKWVADGMNYELRDLLSIYRNPSISKLAATVRLTELDERCARELLECDGWRCSTHYTGNKQTFTMRSIYKSEYYGDYCVFVHTIKHDYICYFAVVCGEVLVKYCN